MQSPWFSNYQEGVPAEVNPAKYSSIVEIIDYCFKKFAPKPAFHNMGKTLSYSELDELSKKFASYLQNDLGLKKGDRLAIMLPNTLQYPIALFGALRAGLAVVNVNPLYTARELEHQMKDSGAKAILIFENSAHTLEEVYKNTDLEHIIVTQIGDMLSFPKSLLVNFVIKHVKKMVPKWNIPEAKSFLDILSKSRSSNFSPVEVRREDLAFLQYTGGTTGVAKGAALVHGNIVANLLQAKAWIDPLVKEGEEIIITALPLYHIFSLTANCFTFSYMGGLNVLITNPRDIPGFVKELSKWKFTAITGVNTLFNALLNNEDFKKLDFSSMRLTLGGGMAVQRAVAEKWIQVTGKPLIEAYGLTETSPAACINPMNTTEYNGYIGLPISSTEVCIKSDENENLPFGEAGEICIKGPQVMKGYWNRPEETKNVMTEDGFFKTGDIGFMTEEGFIKIVDRKKDMILVSGFNVYPNEVEEVAVKHPKVFECAAVGVPTEGCGETVKLFVVKNDDSLTADELKAFCRENLTGYKVPKHYEFRSELPKSNVGKILRKDLRE